jgi:23S rRNA (adenine2503-C2)-methyltransferase
MLKNIKELGLEELGVVMKDWELPSFHARQIFSWIYQKGIIDFEQMSNLPAHLRKHLKENFSNLDLKIAHLDQSLDGTQKFLFKLSDGRLIEAATIPVESRLTGCLSSQAGCKFACAFCASGLIGLKRQLTSVEILDQVLCLKNNNRQPLSHLVFMGMGEPLDNYDNVLKAIRVINAPHAFNIGARRITISTCGIIPGIRRLEEEKLQIELSVSLHSADDKIRTQLMPVNKVYPLKELIESCRHYIKITNRQITFEYLLIKGLNSGLNDAKKLNRLLKGLNSKVNLIVLNSVKETGLESPNKIDVLIFKDYLLKQGIVVTLRKSRGQDIEAACGQLRLRHEEGV